MPFTSIDDTVHDGYALQFPLEQTATLIPPLASVSGDEVVLETVKLAADGSGDLGENGLARAQGTLRPFSVATLRVELK